MQVEDALAVGLRLERLLPLGCNAKSARGYLRDRALTLELAPQNRRQRCRSGRDPEP